MPKTWNRYRHKFLTTRRCSWQPICLYLALASPEEGVIPHDEERGKLIEGIPAR